MKRATLCMLVMLTAACAAHAGRVVLLTDFGEEDFYVGAMKGAVYSVNANADVDTISNHIPKYDIAAAAFVLERSAPEFPGGTVFLCVVDPGVGTKRKPIVMKTKNGSLFVAPDNGMLTLVGDELGVAGVREITNTSIMRPGAASSTFHGRDIFGPTAGNLAAGFPFEQVGPIVSKPVRLKRGAAAMEGEFLVGQIEAVDTYGNVITNIGRAQLESAGYVLGDSIAVLERECRWVNTYGDAAVGDCVALFGSTGVLEFAINQGQLLPPGRIPGDPRIQIRVRQR